MYKIKVISVLNLIVYFYKCVLVFSIKNVVIIKVEVIIVIY